MFSSSGHMNYPFLPEHHTPSGVDSECSDHPAHPYDFRLHAVTVNPDKVLVCERPTTRNGEVSYITISKTFVLDGQPCFWWKVVGVNYRETDAEYIVYIAERIGLGTKIEVVLPRKWD